MRELKWVDTAGQLEEVVALAKSAPIIALDAEMDSYYCYRTKLCLVQLTVGEVDILIDPLALDDLTPLNEVTKDTSIQKVFHAGENDVPYFRKHGVEFSNIFDTHIAAKVLELPTKSLGGLVEHFFDVVLSKDQSRADWRIRPLPEDQVAYARQDTLYLNELAGLLTKELADADGLTEASHLFRAIEPRELREKSFDPDGWAKIKGARDLSGLQRSILSELYTWREKEAEKEDLAAFRVAHNGALLSLSRKRFTNPEQLRGWAKSKIFKDNANELIALLDKGRNRGEIPFPDLRKKDKNWSSADEKLFNKLRGWRNEEAERQEIDPSRILSNKQLKKVARARPKNEKELMAVEGVGSYTVEHYGEEILAHLTA